MAKRQHEAEDTSRPPKRPKPDHQPSQPAEEINFARQLSDLLVFRQDGIQELRHGIASFKAFLESILYHHEADNRGRQLSILREYLDTQKPADASDTERPFLSQLWQAWSFANQNNNDHVASSICAIFALTLKTLSSLLDFRVYGTLLCRTILQHQHLRLIKRCLDAPKHKDFLISPSLRLLTELISFDGGVFAREAYKRREQTFEVAVLRRNLGMFKSDVSEEDAKRRPAIRTLTVRYVLGHLKYQSEGGKIDILKQRPLCTALFSHLRDDPPDLILELLRTTEQNVFKDKTLPRSSKAALLTLQHLERVTEIATRSEHDENTARVAKDWLRAISTIASYGVLRASGWYPPGTTKAELDSNHADGTIDLGLDSIEFYDEPGSFTVRNTTLLAWILMLRPHSDLQERGLALACFKAAPELVHAYFKEKGMQLDPKLTNTWIGYASFIFEVMQLPVPQNLGHTEEGDELADLPPQISIIMDSILPKPLSQKVLSRCLNQSSPLITFFAIRLVVLAFQKFANISIQLKTAPANAALWEEASTRLSSSFAEQCPKIKDVINTFRQMPDDADHVLQREAITRLLRLYFENLPAQALEEQFDVSGALTAALLREEESDNTNHTNHANQLNGEDEQKVVRTLELEHLLAISKLSPGTRWFATQGALKYSPFITLLRLHSKIPFNRARRELLGDVLYQDGIINPPPAQDSGKASPLNALIASVSTPEEQDDSVWAFLDDCLARASKAPVKYLDSIDENMPQVPPGSARPSMLFAVVWEQARHASEKLNGAERVAVMTWACNFIALLGLTSDAGDLLQLGGNHIISSYASPYAVQNIDAKAAIRAVQLTEDTITEPEGAVTNPNETEGNIFEFTAPPLEPKNHPELFRWQQKDIDTVLEDGDADALILCLCSVDSSIRRQAEVQLGLLAAKILAAGEEVEAKDQVYILLGSLVETSTQSQQSARENEKMKLPLPYIVGTFAVRALHVLLSPTHVMYPKLNRYLMKSPCWRMSRMVGYWLESTVLAEPEEDDGYWREIQWVLEWLVDGLRQKSDLDMLRRAGGFERVMALHDSPAASEDKVKRKVMELVYRASLVDASGIVTSTGCLAWLEMVGEGRLRESVLARAREEGGRVREWAGVEV